MGSDGPLSTHCGHAAPAGSFRDRARQHSHCLMTLQAEVPEQMRSSRYLVHLSCINAGMSVLVLLAPTNISVLFVAILVIVASCIVIFQLGLFSMMARIKYPPISSKAATIIGLLSLINTIIAFASIFRYFGIVQASNLTVHHDPLDCLYFSVVTWSTLGYGDFYPAQPARMVAAAEALIGYVGMIGLISIAAQYFVAGAGLSEKEIDEFNKKLANYEARREKKPRR